VRHSLLGEFRRTGYPSFFVFDGLLRQSLVLLALIFCAYLCAVGFLLALLQMALAAIRSEACLSLNTPLSGAV